MGIFNSKQPFFRKLQKSLGFWQRWKPTLEIEVADFHADRKLYRQSISETRSTREQIIDHLKAKGHKPPPASMSSAEMEALIATGDFRVVEASPAPVEELLAELPPTEADNPKELRYGMSHRDRNFWFNLVIGCSGPDLKPTTILSPTRFRSRNAAKLKYAMADVKRLRAFVNNIFTDPLLVMPLGFRMLSGTFAETIYLREPDIAELNCAFAAMQSFFNRNKRDPEWMGGQVNLFFAGHGTNDSHVDPIDRGGLHLRDTVLRAKDLQHRLINALPSDSQEQWRGFSTHGDCRIDMYLDCCFSGQFAAAFIERLLKDRKGLIPGKFWCSSMPFQKSFESRELQHGLFTAYFLNDYSSKRRSAHAPSLKSGDVGKQTANRQNPFLIDFSTDRPPLPIIPGAVGMNWIIKNDAPLPMDVSEGGFAAWLTEFLSVVHQKNWSLD